MAATGTPTPNIGLRIPQGTDPASVDDINYNSNLLDTKLGAVGNTSVQDQIDSLNSKISTIKTLEVPHGTINAGASSTVETPITKKMYIIGYSVGGSYNSDCIPWSYYCTNTTFVSRVKNTGTNNASNISVSYYYFEMQ